MMTGELVSLAASMIAWTCSRLLTLNAPTPYSPFAASSNNCRIVTNGKARPPYFVGFRVRVAQGRTRPNVAPSDAAGATLVSRAARSRVHSPRNCFLAMRLDEGKPAIWERRAEGPRDAAPSRA